MITGMAGVYLICGVVGGFVALGLALGVREFVRWMTYVNNRD